MKNKISPIASGLRKQAEELLRKGSSGVSVFNVEDPILTPSDLQLSQPLSLSETQKLIYELEVHQIELEMQNDELSIAIRDADIAAHKYLKLFEFAPTGYFTLSSEGEIFEINLCGATMLGKSRSHLTSRRFGLFISEGSLNVFNHFLDAIFKSKTRESCEVTILNDSINPTIVFLTGIINDNENECLINAIDITVSKLTEESLQESEEKFRSSFMTSHDAFYIGSMDEGVIYEVNDVFEEVFGYSREETIGKSSLELNLYNNPQDRSRMIAELKKNGFVKDMEMRGQKKNGELIFVLISVRIIQISKQKYILGVIRDISERKLSEEFLQSSQEKYRAIFENIQDIYYQTNLTGIVLEISPSIKKFSEFEREEIIGYPVQNLYANPEERQDLLFDIMAAGELHDYELRIKTKSGKKKIVSINARLIFNSSGMPDHIDGSMRDITRRKQAEDEVKKLQKAIENSNASVVITDNKGNIEYANPYFTQLTGYTREEYSGQNPNVLKSGYHSAAFYKELWKTINSGQTWEGEFYNRKKDGSHFWENAVISPVQNEKNEITHYVAIKTDITAAKKINEELINAKLRAEESDNLKTAFLNNISHEIRTPFNGILGFLSILQSDDLTTAERIEYNSIINDSAHRLMNTINDIAEVSALQTNKITISESEITISTLIDDLTNHFTQDLNRKALSFTITNELPKNITFIYSDKLKLNTILNNLVSNAIKFTNLGTIGLEIRMKDSHIHYGLNENQQISSKESLDSRATNSVVPEPEIEFAIRDTGIGIPENKLKAIFERFIQADSSNTRRFEGSGLGTTIAKAYVEALGGTIRVESKEGQGSLFSFTIPCRTESKEKIALQTRNPGKSAHQVNLLKILIAEDDEASFMYLKMVIKPYTKELLIAKTGQEAVKLCSNNPDIDLVLMDIRMPVLDGNDATIQIRLINPKVIIIAQTAHALTSDNEKAIASGCNDYISKPIQKDQLITLIQKYFRI